jgi:hypothetical protein
MITVSANRFARLVQHTVHGFLLHHSLAVDLDARPPWVGLGAQGAHDLSIYRDSSGQDELFRATARRNTGTGQHLLESLGAH